MSISWRQQFHLPRVFLSAHECDLMKRGFNCGAVVSVVSMRTVLTCMRRVGAVTSCDDEAWQVIHSPTAGRLLFGRGTLKHSKARSLL